MRQQHQLLPYIFSLAFSTVFVQALIFGYDSAGMQGVFIAAAIAYIPLGVLVGFIWSPKLLIVSVLAGISTLLFMFALYQWSIITMLASTVENIPVVFEPLSVSFFFFLGAWVGGKLFTLRKQLTRASPQIRNDIF